MSETKASRLERYRIEGAVDFINGVIQGAREQDDAGLLLCAENAEKAIRCLRVDLASARAELARLTADRDEALTIADKHRLVCQGVEEDFHALEESNERLRTALAVCGKELDDAHNFVQAELDARIATHTIGGDLSTLDETDDGLCGEAMDCLERIGVARDAGKAALAKDV